VSLEERWARRQPAPHPQPSPAPGYTPPQPPPRAHTGPLARDESREASAQALLSDYEDALAASIHNAYAPTNGSAADEAFLLAHSRVLHATVRALRVEVLEAMTEGTY